MDSEDASTFYVSKNKSPLFLIGLGGGYNMVCSDAMAMIRENKINTWKFHDQRVWLS